MVALGAAKGSPGVTAAAMALAATWPGRVVLVEADPDGGALAVRLGITEEAGLVAAAAAVRRDTEADRVGEHVHTLSGRVGALLAPLGAEEAHTALAASDRLAPALATLAGSADVVIDCGRLVPRSPSLPLAARADVVALVVANALDQIVAASHTAVWMRHHHDDVRVVLVGDHPYGPVEVAHGLGVPVAGVLAHDPRGAARLPEIVAADALPRRRGPLLNSAAALVPALVARPPASPRPDPADTDDAEAAETTVPIERGG